MPKKLEDIAKIELHCHLDGSTSIELIKQLADEQNIVLNESHLLVSENCESLAEYLNCFDEILKVLQTKDSLKRAVIDVAQQASNDNVKYIEIRFAPLLHTEKGLDLDEILEAVESGVQIAVETLDININLLRSEEHTSELQSRFEIICRHLLEKKKIQLTLSKLKQ